MDQRHGGNLDTMYLRNQILILQYLQRHGISTRAQIAKAIDLTQAAVSKITGYLIEAGIIEETGFFTGEKGRRSIGIRIAPGGRKVIGVKLSRRNFSVGVFDFAGECLASAHERFAGGDELVVVFHRIRVQVRKYIEDYPDVAAIGMAVPGPFLRDEDKILMMTEMGDKSEQDIDLRAEFNSSRMCGVPVVIGQDANAGALADWWFNLEQRRLHGTIVHFLVGEGVGAGVISNGTLLDGDMGTGGEVGHMSVDINGPRCHCGNYGCLEMYCSSIAFVKQAMKERASDPSSELNRYPELSAQTIFRAAQSGDELSQRLVTRVAQYIGCGVVNMINIYNPSTIIICNEMAGGGDRLIEQVRQYAKERLIGRIYDGCEIVLSQFAGDDILYGAAAVAIDYCLTRPSIMALAGARKVNADAAENSVG